MALKAALYSSFELAPLGMRFGSLAAIEVTKMWGNGTPASWFHLDFFDHLSLSPPSLSPPREEHLYYHQAGLFGDDFLSRFSNLRWCVIGCNPTGNEVLKTMSLLGAGSGPSGYIYLCDDNVFGPSESAYWHLEGEIEVGKERNQFAAENIAKLRPGTKLTPLSFPFKLMNNSVGVSPAQPIPQPELLLALQNVDGVISTVPKLDFLTPAVFQCAKPMVSIASSFSFLHLSLFIFV